MGATRSVSGQGGTQQGGERSITAGENQLYGSTSPVIVGHGITPPEEAPKRFTLWKQPDPFQGFSRQRDIVTFLLQFPR